MKTLSRRWKRGFEVAAAAREHSNGPRPGYRLGAALFSGNKLLSVGFNTYLKTHPNSRTYTFNTCIHAEVAAILKRRHYGDSNLIMYVYRENSSGLACSKPCGICQEWLKEAGVHRVRYIDYKLNYVEMKI